MSKSAAFRGWIAVYSSAPLTTLDAAATIQATAITKLFVATQLAIYVLLGR